MKSIFRMLTAIVFSLLLVLTPAVAVFADDNSVADSIPAADTQETNKDSENLKSKPEKPDDDNDSDIKPYDDSNDNDNDDEDDNDLSGGDNGDDDNDLSDGGDQNLGDDDDDEDDPSDPAPIAKPFTVSITDFGNTYYYEVEDDGTVRIAGLFNTFDPGAFGSESFVMIVHGFAYPITIFSDGKVFGRLPRGFYIKNGELIIEGITSDMDIYFEDHSMISGTSESPDGDGSYYEPPKTDKKSQRRSSGAPAGTFTNTVKPAAVSETVAVEDKPVPVVSSASDNVETEKVLDAYEDSEEASGRHLPLATGIVLSVGAVSGLGVLLKLKLFATI